MHFGSPGTYSKTCVYLHHWGTVSTPNLSWRRRRRTSLRQQQVGQSIETLFPLPSSWNGLGFQFVAPCFEDVPQASEYIRDMFFKPTILNTSACQGV